MWGRGGRWALPEVGLGSGPLPTPFTPALQEKVAEVETRLREQLTDTERRLNEARREHAKAVVSLRQIQRRATREKERNQELRRLQDEARKEEGQRLTQRVQELERDKNLMLVGDSRAQGQSGGRAGRLCPRQAVPNLSFPGHLAAGGSPLPLQAAATLGSSSFSTEQGETGRVPAAAVGVLSVHSSSRNVNVVLHPAVLKGVHLYAAG